MPELHERTWSVADPKAAVVIVHGLAEHSGRYEHVAQALNEAGYSAYARDLRGHGQSVGFPGEMGGDVERLYEDLVEHCVAVSSSHDKTFLLAHSLGTILSLPAVAKMPKGTLDGLVLSGMAAMSGPATLESLGSGRGVPPEAICTDPEVVKAYVEDPFVFYDKVPQEALALAVQATLAVSDAVAQISVPVLLVHGGGDTICDLQGAQFVHTQLVVTDKTLRVYEDMYHEVLNEPGREQVLKDIIAWLDAH